MTQQTVETVLAPKDAYQRLLEGNRRFVDSGGNWTGRRWYPSLAEDPQKPFAIILGCSDSRVPVEILFDQGFGDLFVVRVAGNIIAPSLVGSVEFAASQFGSALVVVLGHTGCGAISATVNEIETSDAPGSKNLRAITERIAPHIRGIVERGADNEGARAELLREAMQANVRASASHLRHGSRILEDLVLSGRLAVVGAELELETGRVRFLDPAPQASSE